MRKLIASGLVALTLIASPVFGRGFGGLKSSPKNTIEKPVVNPYSLSRVPNKPVTNIREILKGDYKTCFDYASDEIEYVSDGKTDYWQNPDQTRKRKKGDCDDKGFLLHDDLKLKKITSRVVFGYMENNPKDGHIWVELKYYDDWLILDPSNGEVYKKSMFFKNPRGDYIEFNEATGNRKKVEDFIKSYENRLLTF